MRMLVKVVENKIVEIIYREFPTMNDLMHLYDVTNLVSAGVVPLGWTLTVHENKITLVQP